MLTVAKSNNLYNPGVTSTFSGLRAHQHVAMADFHGVAQRAP